MKAGFSVEKVAVTNGPFKYTAYRLTGWQDGRRIRKQFPNRDEAEGARLELEIQAANRANAIRPVNTRLSPAQVAEAEAVFSRLGSRPLAEAVDWFLANYRPPKAAMALATATAAFLVDRAQHVRPVVLSDYSKTFNRLNAEFPGKNVGDITTADVQRFLTSRQIGKKRFNNLRGELSTLFAFCIKSPQNWIAENPVKAVEVFKVSRDLPEIITAAKAAEIMQFAESYTGGTRDLPPGCMVPYFALCLFARLRPSTENGEISKLAASPDLARAVDTALGAIRISPEISKVKSVRQITIQPNLASWLARYPLKDFPILPLGSKKMVNEIRHKFGIGQDVMRHTFISMHVAKFKSMGAAALEAGNSETMIRKHYYNLVSDADAVAFWGIKPSA
ncbi:MAG: hypothetical protein H7343_19150 [Undibacterium sp.]|nr:hypothetical protein [Opitutaceae bacterium]